MSDSNGGNGGANNISNGGSNTNASGATNNNGSNGNSGNNGSNDVTMMDIDTQTSSSSTSSDNNVMQLPRLAGVMETVKRYCSEAHIELTNATRNAIWQLIVDEDRDLITIIDNQIGREAQTKAVLILIQKRASASSSSLTSSSGAFISGNSDNTMVQPSSSPPTSSAASTASTASASSSSSSAASSVATTPMGTVLPTPTAMPSPVLVPVAVTPSTSNVSLMSLSPTSVASAVIAAPSSSSTPVDGITEIAFSGALITFGKNKPPVVKASAKAMVNILTQLKANPRDASKRKMRLDHIIVKKQIVEVPGALSFMNAVGFRSCLEADKKNYLLIDENLVNVDIITRAIELLNERITTADTPAAIAPVDNVKRDCVQGCGFFGDSQWDGMCSQCYKNRNGSSAKKTETKSLPSAKCKKGCGFFGAERFGGMCSVCFGKEPKVARHWRKKWSLVKRVVMVAIRFGRGRRPVQTDKKRCWNCRKKIGISGGLECRCGYTFCTSHRYPHEHACTFDFKEHHKRKLMTENRIVAGKKFDRIDDEREDDTPPKDESKGGGTGGSSNNNGNKSPRR